MRFVSLHPESGTRTAMNPQVKLRPDDTRARIMETADALFRRMGFAKTAVADGRWARVGSTNLNIASWMGNRELDVVVEDEPSIRQMVRRVLEKEGWVVREAENGQAGLRAVSENKPAVILLDLMMPVMSGWEVLDRLAKDDPSSRPIVLVFTAGSEPREASPELVIGNIRKPFDVDLLLDVVTACLSTLSD